MNEIRYNDDISKRSATDNTCIVLRISPSYVSVNKSVMIALDCSPEYFRCRSSVEETKFQIRIPGRGQFGSQGYYYYNLCREPLDNATYKISNSLRHIVSD